jgi:hypothetical protein
MGGEPLGQALQAALSPDQRGFTLGHISRIVGAKPRSESIIQYRKCTQPLGDSHFAQHACFFGFNFGPAGAQRAQVLPDLILLRHRLQSADTPIIS